MAFTRYLPRDIDRLASSLAMFGPLKNQIPKGTPKNHFEATAVSMAVARMTCRRSVAAVKLNFLMTLTEIPPVDGHRGQLREAMFNLVRNAIEAMGTTTNGSRVLRVRTELRGRDAIAVAVEDSGPGIDPQKLESIFTAFLTTKSQGMGLGLAICRMIVEHHGGQLTASSDGKSGALFQLVLPTASTDKTARETGLITSGITSK